MYFMVKNKVKQTLFLLIKFDNFVNKRDDEGFIPINPLVIYDQMGRDDKQMEDYYECGLLHRYLKENEREVIRSFFSGSYFLEA